MKPCQIQKKMLQQYACIAREEWKLVDALKVGEPQSVMSNTLSQHDHHWWEGELPCIIPKSKCIYLEVMTRELDISIRSAQTILVEVLKYHQMCAQCMPRMLIDEHKMN